MRSAETSAEPVSAAGPSRPGGSDTVPRWAVDAGGSRTRVLLDDGTGWETGTVNPASVGAATAQETLAGLLARVAAHVDGVPSAGWIASASIPDEGAALHAAGLAGAAARAGLTGTVVVTRDTAPLLYAPPLRGRGLVVVSGTGSAVVAGDGQGPPVPVGGCEYLGSDEGSAYALGLAGLRAAVRAADGRAAPTALGARLCAQAGADASGGRTHDVRALARRLAAEPFPKRAVAALAPAVCRCWLDGDEAAARVVEEALDDLADAARAGRDTAGLTDGWRVLLVGGVFHGCRPFADAFAGRLARLGATGPPLIPADTTEVVLGALSLWQHTGGTHHPAGGHVVDLPEPAPTGGTP